MRYQLLVFAMSIVLTACSSGAVVFAPTPLPPDLSPTKYEHPSGAFSVVLPRNWSAFSQHTDVLASTAFAPPNQTDSLLVISVINLGQEISDAQLRTLMLDYQTQVRPDASRYTEQDRQSLSDGSWRLTGLRLTSTGETQQLNTFIQTERGLVAILETQLSPDSTLTTNLQGIVNTFELQSGDALTPSPMSALSSLAWNPLEIVNVTTWTTADNVFYITGEVTNHSGQDLSNIPIRAVLQDESGQAIAEAVDSIMGYTLVPEGFVPFSLRFGQGQTPEASQYFIEVGQGDWLTNTPIDIVTDDLSWTDEIEFNENEHLVISGTITNDRDESVQAIRVVATIFDDVGQVVAAGFVDADDEILKAGDSTDFRLLIQDRGGVPTNYILTVQALPCDADCE